VSLVSHLVIIALLLLFTDDKVNSLVGSSATGSAKGQPATANERERQGDLIVIK